MKVAPWSRITFDFPWNFSSTVTAPKETSQLVTSPTVDSCNKNWTFFDKTNKKGKYHTLKFYACVMFYVVQFQPYSPRARTQRNASFVKLGWASRAAVYNRREGTQESLPEVALHVPGLRNEHEAAPKTLSRRRQSRLLNLIKCSTSSEPFAAPPSRPYPFKSSLELMGSPGILMCILHERVFHLCNAFAIARVSSRNVKFDKVRPYCENKFCRLPSLFALRKFGRHDSQSGAWNCAVTMN